MRCLPVAPPSPPAFLLLHSPTFVMTSIKTFSPFHNHRESNTSSHDEESNPKEEMMGQDLRIHTSSISSYIPHRTSPIPHPCHNPWCGDLCCLCARPTDVPLPLRGFITSFNLRNWRLILVFRLATTVWLGTSPTETHIIH